MVYRCPHPYSAGATSDSQLGGAPALKRRTLLHPRVSSPSSALFLTSARCSICSALPAPFRASLSAASRISTPYASAPSYGRQSKSTPMIFCANGGWKEGEDAFQEFGRGQDRGGSSVGRRRMVYKRRVSN